MLKHFLATLLGLSGLAAHAQTTLPAGTWQLGGNVGFSQQHNETSGVGSGGSYTNKEFSVSPTVGYLVADNLALGVEAGYSIVKYEGVDNYNSSYFNRTTEGYSAGLFADYYRLLGQYFGLKGRLAASYSHGIYDYLSGNLSSANQSRSISNGVGTSLVPSLLFFPVPRLALGASLGGLYYSYNKSTSSPDIINNEGHGYNVGAYFGLNQLAFSGTFFPGRK